MSLRDGTKKMSKSDPSDQSRINLNDDADTIALKIRRAKTDPEPLPSETAGPGAAARGAQPGRHLCRAGRHRPRRGAARAWRQGVRRVQGGADRAAGGEAGADRGGNAAAAGRSRRRSTRCCATAPSGRRRSPTRSWRRRSGWSGFCRAVRPRCGPAEGPDTVHPASRPVDGSPCNPSHAPRTRVQRIAHPIADQILRQHQHHQCQPRQHGRPPRPAEQILYPCATRSPSEGVVTATPSPRNDSDASSSTARGISTEICTSSGPARSAAGAGTRSGPATRPRSIAAITVVLSAAPPARSPGPAAHIAPSPPRR